MMINDSKASCVMRTIADDNVLLHQSQVSVIQLGT
ncbi:hypothetical protein XFLM_06300 [Xylella fastidiosa subsp. fastidiosa GB514]|jgi:hypothetical protein|nr:hypothetical protein XFLM_06300 [Xylella fastidiosa subsp. fastidiosa GB514]KAF0571786.1 hypothetical protein P305_10205 [Xylella fastidiosa subsp. fastidiosa Mus-1]